MLPPNAVDPNTYGPPIDPIAPLRAALRGHYDIEREIGQGAFATVYLARDLKHERKVALKVLNADPTSETSELRFIREIRTLARLQHPNILPLHDSGHVEALLYYVMPFVSGETLRDRINRQKQLPLEDACSIARDVGDALAYAHAQGIIHRDIKPENILLSTGHPILADFGIARAIDLAGVRNLTRTGAASPGTPAYMSPEQLMGEAELDGRSDSYSLGCVLFEMLTGRPPFAGKEGFVKRFTEPPPKASTFRKDLPKWVDDAIEGVLQRAPQDRYATAREFVAALCEPRLHNGTVGTSDPTRRHEASAAMTPPRVAPDIRADVGPFSLRSLVAPIRSHPRIATALSIGLVAAALALGATGRSSRVFAAFGRGVAVDTARLVVLPFAGPGSVGGQVAANLYDAFAEWEELPLVPDTRVAQAIKESGAPTTEGEAIALGKKLGAGKVIWGMVSGSSGSARVRVHLYDVASSESKDDFVFDETTSRPDRYTAASNRLLGIRERPTAGEGCDAGTRSFPAWSACGRGHRSLKAWNVGDAEREFRAAIAADPDYPTPRLWLAQMVSWMGFDTRSEWRDLVARASAQEAFLSAHDRTLASALHALAKGRFPEACDTYSSLARANPRDFVALYGLGQCNEMDSLVVASPSSPSGFRFRSSNDAAAKNYMQALRIEPGAHSVLSFDRLQRLLPTATAQIRLGYSAPPEPQLYAAWPRLSGDTVGYVPFTPDAFAKVAAGTSRRAALDRDSDLLLDFVLNWSQQSNDDPTAFEALADLLETRGELSDAGGARPSALAAIHRAGALARDPRQRMRVRAREVSIRFKRSEFALARTLADSVLAEPSDSAVVDLRLQGGLASLTGKLARTIELTRLSGVYIPASNLAIPPRVGGPAAAFFASAVLGVCGPEIDQLERELDAAISSSFSENDRERARADLKSRPLGFTAPCTNGSASLKIPAPADKVLRMQQTLAKGNRTALRSQLDSASAVTRTQRPSDLSVDYTYQLAWLRVASGDTASAIANLDIALGALPSLSAGSLRDVAPAAAAVRAMMLRAELAAAKNDLPTARRWASAVATLWAGADPSLMPAVKRMRSIASIANKK
jgi:serine/threonine protein kinase/tetratricopeptide (TPR) repeat protein